MEPLKILHFTSGKIGGVRLQRYIQNNIDKYHSPIVLVPKGKGIEKDDPRTLPWTENKVYWYEYNNFLRHMIPFTRIGLKKVFEKENCDIVHAHQIETAYHSYKEGLPTVFDDWEYHLNYSLLRHCLALSRLRGTTLSKTIKKTALNRLYKKRCKVILELLEKVPVIVTNDEVKKAYEELDAKHISTVPNVPVKKEVDYAFKEEYIKKESVLTTCYIGDLTQDENNILRCTKGVKEVWEKNDLGKLHIFENENLVPHLEIMPKIRHFHFNLLYWNPKKAHRYYIQNKPFLASAVGLPTIISSSLTSTIALLREHALIVDSLSEIPQTIKEYNPETELRRYQDQYFEFYEDRVQSAYKQALR